MSAPVSPTVLITGAGGFVMRTVAARLLAHGCRVVAVDRAFSQPQPLRWQHCQQSLTCIEADAADLPILDDVDTLIMGAAITAHPQDLGITPEEFMRQSLLPFLHGLEWAQRCRVRRVIAISSDAIYAQSEGPMTEDAPPVPEGYYAVVKTTVEQFVRALHGQAQRDCVAVRLSSVYGEGETISASRPFVSMVTQLVEEAITLGVVHPAEEAPRDWTYSRDIGDALMALINQKTLRYPVYNVASGQVVSPHDIASLIQQIIPEVGIMDAVPSRRSPKRRGWLANERLQQETGFDAWTPLEEGLRRVIAVRRHASAKVSA
jgi:nucleoside-diphosphate-sugar epimerase